MKEYPVTSRELWTLGGLQAGAALALSVSGWLFGFWVNAEQALDMAGSDVSKDALAQWGAYANMAWYAALGVGVLGLFLIALSGFNVWGVLRDTSHED